MAARELSRTADFAAGTLIVQIDDGYGNTIPHTVNVLGVADPEQDIADAILRVEQQADAKAHAFRAVGLGS